MTHSESIKSLAAALVTFHSKVEAVSRDAENPFFKKSYASLSNILDVIREPMAEAGLSFVQFPEGENSLTTMLLHGASGEWMQGTYIMQPVKVDPQSRGSAITYQRRYALSAVLGLNILEDDDGNAATQGPAPAKRQQAQAPQGTQAAPQIDGAWYARIERCKSLADLTSSFNEYKEEIEKNPAIKKLYSERKAQLTKNKSQPA